MGTEETYPRRDVATELASRLYNAPLAIAPDYIRLILHARIDTTDLRMWMHEEETSLEARVPQLDAVGGKPYANVDGVAVIPVTGSLFRSAFFSDYDAIQSSFDTAMADSGVSSILLEVDSPGGEVRGMFDLADHIYNARGTKPIVALANDQMTSAAYAIGSSADKVFASRSSVLGSIGVVAIHVDESEAAEKAGVKFTEISSGKLKTELSSTKPLSDLGRSILTKHVENSAEQFFDLVSRNRGISTESIRGQEAGLFFAGEAVDANLADGIADRSDLLGELAGAQTHPAVSGISSVAAAAELNSDQGGDSMSNEVIETPEVPVGDDVQVTHAAASEPEIEADSDESSEVVNLEQVREEARAELQADAKAIAELCSIAGSPGRAAEFIAEGLNADQARTRLLADRASSAGNELSNAVDPNESAARPVIDTAAIYRKRAERTRPRG